MRDKQPKKDDLLPSSLYHKVLYIVRDYDRMRQQRNVILYETPPHGITGKGTVGNPTEAKAVKLDTINTEIAAIENAIKAVPKEYALHIFNNIRYGTPYPSTACKNTWSTWRIRFLQNVAKNLKYI